ncbi:OmpA family protein [Lysobacter enzymogenes]|uniref:OmpA family protein n=1 Tax=Lysobacter enzymogenes TaxID=69 RepID=UPI0019CFFC79|nr:OmpA family protein [Lysobacter enzymogenes]
MSALQRIFMLAALYFFLAACSSTHETPSRPDRSKAFVNNDEFRGIYFKENSPQGEEAIHSALSTTLGDSRLALAHDLELIKKFNKDEKFRVVGFTDNVECQASDCNALSLRRAKAFQDWLIGKGISATRFYPPRGYGSARPIGNNLTEVGRATNRRAHISYGSDLDN